MLPSTCFEILPDEAKAGGVAISSTGRSDFPNQVNNVLACTGVFRGALDAKAKQISPEMKIAAAHALTASFKEPTAEQILPSALDATVAPMVAAALAAAAATYEHPEGKPSAFLIVSVL